MRSILMFSVFVVMSCNNDHKKEVIFTSKSPKPVGSYSQAILSGGTLFVSGQIGMNASGILDSSSFENECTQALKNIKTIVTEAGMTMEDVTKATIYLTDLKNFNKMNDVFGNYFVTAPPARETVQVNALPKNAHVEISVIAK